MRKQTGLSLLELTVVIAILGITAVVVMPNLSSTDPARLDLAAEHYASAIRFARAESMNSGHPLGFRVRDDVHFIKVKSVDQSTSPWSFIWDVYHPISKKLYIVDLKELSGTNNITSNLVTSYRGTCNSNRNVYFDRHGAAWCLDPEQVGVIQHDITLSLGSHSSIVSLDGITGRVTVQ